MISVLSKMCKFVGAKHEILSWIQYLISHSWFFFLTFVYSYWSIRYRIIYFSSFRPPQYWKCIAQLKTIFEIKIDDVLDFYSANSLNQQSMHEWAYLFTQDTLSQLGANPSLFLLLYCACLDRNHLKPILTSLIFNICLHHVLFTRFLEVFQISWR
jgi:hypothetical protein